MRIYYIRQEEGACEEICDSQGNMRYYSHVVARYPGSTHVECLDLVPTPARHMYSFELQHRVWSSKNVGGRQHDHEDATLGERHIFCRYECYGQHPTYVTTGSAFDARAVIITSASASNS